MAGSVSAHITERLRREVWNGVFMDVIEIRNLKIYAYHGVFDEEKETGQSFLVSARLYLDLRPSSMSDDLLETVSYDEVAHTIEQVVTGEKWNLIEAVAESVASEILLKYTKIRSVQVRVDKPEAPIGLPFDTVSVTIERGRHTVYLGIGSNLGDRRQYLDQAIEQLGKDPYIRVIRSADYIETEPFGPVEQPDFLNGAVELETLYSPRELLSVLHDIEQEAGRKRIVHWGPRTLDLDILLYDDAVIREEGLLIPHVEMERRAFVLEPLAQIAPHAVHPISRKTIIQLLEELRLKEPNAKPYDVSDYHFTEDLEREGMRVCYAGVPGAYAEAAALKFFGDGADLMNVKTFDEVAEAVASGKADYGVLPVENSSAGFVSGNYDIIRNAGVTIVDEVVLDIEHALLGLPNAMLSDIKKVYSHPQGIMQCKEYIESHQFGTETVSNTALAAKRVMESKDVTRAAIASERAAELYNLKVLARRINFTRDNATRFVIITKEKRVLTGSDNVLICFIAPHRVGALYQIMGIINRNSINMTRIESRPSLKKKWEYSFYVSFEGKLSDRNVQKLLGEIDCEAEDLTVLGTFSS